MKLLNLGELELIILSDGYQVMKPVHPIFAPYGDKGEVEQLLAEHGRSVGQVEISLHILLIRKGQRLIMIDSGLGDWEDTSGRLGRALAEAGLSKGAITDIVLTHGHPDHIGGLVSKDGTLLFPGAAIYISRSEYDFWMSGSPDFSASPLIEHPDILCGLIRQVKRLLTAITPQLRFFNPDSMLFDCIRLHASPGHTPGHVVMTIFSGEERLFHCADLVHSDVLLFPHPEWGVLFDTDWKQAAETRSRILEELAATGENVLAYHLPWPGLGRVARRGNGFEWIPEILVG